MDTELQGTRVRAHGASGTLVSEESAARPLKIGWCCPWAPNLKTYSGDARTIGRSAHSRMPRTGARTRAVRVTFEDHEVAQHATTAGVHKDTGFYSSVFLKF